MSIELGNAFLAFVNSLQLDPTLKYLIIGIGSPLAFFAPFVALGVAIILLEKEVRRVIRRSTR